MIHKNKILDFSNEEEIGSEQHYAESVPDAQNASCFEKIKVKLLHLHSNTLAPTLTQSPNEFPDKAGGERRKLVSQQSGHDTSQDLHTENNLFDDSHTGIKDKSGDINL